MTNNVKKIRLYFTRDLSANNVLNLKLQGFKVRDASAWRPDDAIENCDEAAGEVPEPYKKFMQTHGNSPDCGAEKGAGGGGDDMSPKTIAELKAALIQMGVELPEKPKLAELKALYEQYKGANGSDNGDVSDQGTE